MSSSLQLSEEVLSKMPKEMPRKNWQVAPRMEYSHKNNCVFWSRKERYHAVEYSKISQAVVEEIATIAGWRAADSDSKTAWIWWVVHIREVLGIPILQIGHGHRKPGGGSLECLSVIWISGLGEGGQTSVEKMKSFASLVRIQESDIEEMYGDGGCSA